MVFKSRVQWTLFAPIFLLLSGIGVFCALQGVWLIMVINASVMLFIVHNLFTTDYTISGDALVIRSGLMFRTVVPIKSIRKIKPSTSVLSAPALSLKGRLELFYGKSATLIISPADPDSFLCTLLEINPDISH